MDLHRAWKYGPGFRMSAADRCCTSFAKAISSSPSLLARTTCSVSPRGRTAAHARASYLVSPSGNGLIGRFSLAGSVLHDAAHLGLRVR